MAAEAHAVPGFVSAPLGITRGLRRLRRRIRLLLVLRFATLTISVLALPASLLLLFLRLRDLWFPPLTPGFALGVTLLTSVLAALCYRLPDALVAASTDRRLALRDRLGTALQLVHAPAQTGMEQAMVHDALEHVWQAAPAEAFPFHFTRATKLAALGVLAVALAQLLPIPALLLSPQERDDRAFLRQEAARIEPVAKKLERQAEQAQDVEAKELAQRLQHLAKELKRGQMQKREALLKLNQADRQLEETAQRLAPPQPKTAQQASEDMTQAAQRDLASRAQDLAKQAAAKHEPKQEEALRKLAEQAKKTKDPEQLRKLAKEMERRAGQLKLARSLPMDLMPNLALALSSEDLDKLSEALDALNDLPNDLTPAELAALAKQLEAMSKALKDSDLALLAKELEKASKCMKSGNCKLSKAALAKALKDAKALLARLKLAGVCRNGMSGFGRGVGPGDSQGKLLPGGPGAALYSPETIPTAGSLSRLPGQIKPGGKMLTTTEIGAPDKVEGSRVPYYEVIGEYSKEAEEALSKEEVPSGYRASVRQYFQSLQGTGGGGKAKQTKPATGTKTP